LTCTLTKKGITVTYTVQNLHNRGLKEMARQLELHPGESSGGFIEYALDFEGEGEG
jgi:hypothetical protein